MSKIKIGDKVEVVGTGIVGEIVEHNFENNYIKIGRKGEVLNAKDCPKIKKLGKQLALYDGINYMRLAGFNDQSKLKKVG